MSVVDEIPPRLRIEIAISPSDRQGNVVVKNQRKRTYLRLGAQEHFLLSKLDGQTSYGSIVTEFERHFSERISCEEIQGFVKSADKHGLICRDTDSPEGVTPVEPAGLKRTSFQVKDLLQKCITAAKRQSVLYFRIPLFDPERVLNRLAPATRWLFSLELFCLVAVTGLWAVLTTWMQRGAIAQQVASLINWQSFAVMFLTTLVVTVFHEFGHGLACKKFGGEVREMGFLCIFFTPCFYCNVSDAWLLPNRWHRFVISAAGTYVDFIIWIISVFFWRITVAGTLPNLMALAVVSTCGMRVLFNINPLLRLDGYYALSDLLGQHNLRRRSRARLMEYVRWIMWGGKRPVAIDDGKVLLAFGMISWLFVVGFISLLGLKLTQWLSSMLGVASIIGGVTFVSVLLKRYFQGSLGEEFRNMLSNRKTRLLILLAIFAGVMLIPLSDRVGGEFQVKALVHWEVRAPIAGFLREINVQEGDGVAVSQAIAKIEVPELNSQIARKKSEIAEVNAILNRMQAGSRQEEVFEQEQRIQRSEAWKELAEHDLQQAQESFKQELASLDIRIEQAVKELDYRTTIAAQAQQLHDQGGLAGRQLLSIKKNVFDAQAQHDELIAKKRAREAEGVLVYEGELARREKELADQRSTLKLLEAGTRSEDIEAQQAQLVRLNEEYRHLQEQEQMQLISCPVSGTVITARLTDKIGQYFERGAVICVVEDLSQMEAEIAVAEHDAQTLVSDQPVMLKPRSLPFVSIEGKVDRIAPATATPENPAARKTVTVYCRIDNANSELRTGMTGYGRVYFGTRPLGWLIYNRSVRLLRSEFWL